VDDYVQFNNPVIPVGEKSVKFKIKLNSKPQDIGDSKYWYPIFDTMSYGYHTKGFGCIVNSHGHLWSFGGASQGQSLIYNVGGDNVCDGQWHDVIFTWDGTTNEDGVKIYIDDITVPFAKTTALSSSETNNDNDLRIGKSYNTDSTLLSFDGILDDIEIYNRAYIPPSDPKNLTATPGNKKVNLSWDKVEGAEKYIVKRSETKGGPYKEIGETNETSYTDSGLENGTKYYYVVCAVKNGATSPNSNEVSAIPEGSSGSGDNGLLRITMINGTINEYDLSMSDVEDFIDWYEDRADDRGKPYYIVEKDYNIGPFESRKDYLVFDKILQFEVMEYNK
jgi:hypothetical protein